MNDQASSSADSPVTSACASPIRVLAAWQPGHAGDECLEMAAWLSRSLKLRLRAVSTYLRLWPTVNRGKLGGSYRDWLKQEASSYSEEVQRALKRCGIPRSMWDKEVGIVREGPNEAGLLTDAAAEFGADLILVGSRASAPKGRFLAGTTTDSLLHSSPIPLGLAPRERKLAKRGITRVNVAFLNATMPEDTYPLFFAGELAQRLGVPVRLVAFSPTGMGNSALDERIDFGRELAAEWHEHAFGMLDRARDTIIDHLPDLEVETALGAGTGWPGAVDALKWKKGDLLTMGSTPSGPLERVFLGSTAAQFLQNVPVPVIVHPARRS